MSETDDEVGIYEPINSSVYALEDYVTAPAPR